MELNKSKKKSDINKESIVSARDHKCYFIGTTLFQLVHYDVIQIRFEGIKNTIRFHKAWRK